MQYYILKTDTFCNLNVYHFLLLNQVKVNRYILQNKRFLKHVYFSKILNTLAIFLLSIYKKNLTICFHFMSTPQPQGRM